MLYGDVVGKNPIRKLVSDFIKYFSQIQTLNLFFFTTFLIVIQQEYSLLMIRHESCIVIVFLQNRLSKHLSAERSQDFNQIS